ncbi:RING1 and YY1-binding protein [Athene cunicularia]|uniref:RING1 and YY1-binding protein n=1 Tax=Athene cunicularia TaxID=194338 RepID=UPI000EF64288|nr:RING1 and YY1-binding protein [Athene cunicularia]
MAHAIAGEPHWSPTDAYSHGRHHLVRCSGKEELGSEISAVCQRPREPCLEPGRGKMARKPRINSQLVAQQVAQQYATPPPPKKEKKEKVEKQDKEKPDKEKEISPSVTKKNTNKKTKPKSDIVKDPPSEANSIQSGNTTTKTSDSNHTSRPRLKNVDRSTAQQLAVTVGNVTVIITDFKEKTRSSSTSSSTVTSSAGSEQQNQSSSGSESTDKGSSRSSTPKGDMSAVNDESF